MLHEAWIDLLSEVRHTVTHHDSTSPLRLKHDVYMAALTRHLSALEPAMANQLAISTQLRKQNRELSRTNRELQEQIRHLTNRIAEASTTQENES